MSETTRAIVLDARPHGENGALVTVFTQDAGLKRGRVAGVRKKAGFLQAGNVLTVAHHRRLSHQLGTFTIEPEADYITSHLENPAALLAVQYLSELLSRAIPEEQALPELYAVTEIFLQELGAKGLWQRLAFYELTLLTTLGYGLSLTEETGAVYCKSGTRLAYVSPKTGRAVSEVMGHPFRDKIFVLPHIFGGLEVPENEDRSQTFLLTGHFLEKILHGHGLTSRLSALQALGV